MRFASSAILALPLALTLLTAGTVTACGSDAGADESGIPAVERHPEETTADGGGSSPGDDGGTTPDANTLPACIAQPACDGAAGPSVGAKRPWVHVSSNVIAASGPAFHRGRDLILAEGDAQWVIGKFSYSYIDKDLKDEDVDIYLERGCGGSWDKLGTTRTTAESAHATVEGVEDSGGRVYFEIPKAKALGVGRHRVRLVVAGDLSSTDLVIDVVPAGSPVVVSDVDGTLTSSENAEYPALLTGSLPEARPDAATMLSTLTAKGYHVVYVTARPEWLTGRTHEFLKASNFPRGIVHTTTSLTGALNEAAATFKTAELAAIEAHGLPVEWAFGNRASDGTAYQAAKIPLAQRVFLQETDVFGGKRIEAYSEMLPIVSALPALCQ